MRFYPPFVIVASLLAVGGCASAERQDLERYVTRDARDVEQMEHVTLQAMRNAHHDRFSNPQKLALFRDKLLPLATRYVKSLDAIHPATGAITELHAIRLEAGRLQQQAIGDFVTALERDDEVLAAAAGKKFGEYMAKLEAFHAKQQQLEKKLGWASRP